MRGLIGCECSGAIRREFRKLGHKVYSCDLKPAEDGGEHIQDDLLRVIRSQCWDFLIAHPECRYLSSSGYHWCYRDPTRLAKVQEAVDFFLAVANCGIERVCIENPVGIMSTRYRKPDQIVQPYQFGDDASKATCLWLRGLPKLQIPSRDLWVQPRICAGKPRWANQTDSGQNRLGPSETRSEERARTYPGIARAMATTWGSTNSGPTPEGD